MNRTLLNGVLALAFTVGALVLWRYAGDDDTVAEPPQRSDYVLRDFELITLDKDGREAFSVVGPYLQRDVSGKSLSLVQPRFSFPDAQGNGRWNARADNAWISPGADEVHLLHSVRLVGPESAAGIATRFETERLLILPDTEEARTEHRVTITQGDSILAGTRLRADMKAKRFQLANPEGRYAPRND